MEARCLKAMPVQRIKQMIFALHRITGIGWHAIKRAADGQLWQKDEWSFEYLREIGFNTAQAEKISQASEGWEISNPLPDRNFANYIHALTPFDSQYPQLLQEIAQPPWLIYAVGRLELLHNQAIAIVGTRMPTSYGRQTALKLSQELSGGGLTIVSGLARGIDACAHEAALERPGGTIAVLPTPINVCYPPEHQLLYNKLSVSGLLISETPFGTRLHPGQFHQRNRIIAALSAVTVVVESAQSSGSLITAKHAFEMNKELFAVPGQIQSPKSAGTNELIRTGAARLLSEAKQIFEELPWLRPVRGKMAENGLVSAKSAEQDRWMGLSEEEAGLVQLLQEEPLSRDEIFERLSIPFGHLNILLLNLCIKQKIELQAGSVYRVL